MSTTAKGQIILTLLGAWALMGCAQQDPNASGDTGDTADTKSNTPAGTRASQKFQLGSANDQSHPLIFNWDCTNWLKDCHYRLGVYTYPDIESMASHWADDHVPKGVDAVVHTFNLGVAHWGMIDTRDNSTVLSPVEDDLLCGLTPGVGWKCPTPYSQSSSEQKLGSVKAGASLAIKVWYGPTTNGLESSDGTPIPDVAPGIDLSEFPSPVPLKIALDWGDTSYEPSAPPTEEDEGDALADWLRMGGNN
jgi:hypothetical protein